MPHNSTTIEDLRFVFVGGELGSTAAKRDAKALQVVHMAAEMAPIAKVSFFWEFIVSHSVAVHADLGSTLHLVNGCNDKTAGTSCAWADKRVHNRSGDWAMW